VPELILKERFYSGSVVWFGASPCFISQTEDRFGSVISHQGGRDPVTVVNQKPMKRQTGRRNCGLPFIVNAGGQTLKESFEEKKHVRIGGLVDLVSQPIDRLSGALYSSLFPMVGVIPRYVGVRAGSEIPRPWP
jgi:hypothetical protein